MALPQMKDSDIISAMIARFSAITAGADYNYTYDNIDDKFPQAGAALEDGEGKNININQSFEENLGELSQGNQVLQDVKMTVEINLLGAGSSADIRKMKADIMKSIGEDLTWGGNAFYTKFISAQYNKKDIYEHKISDLTITIEVQYRQYAWAIQ